MTVHIWEKYNVITNTTTGYKEKWAIQAHTLSYDSTFEKIRAFNSYTFDTSTGKYKPTNPVKVYPTQLGSYKYLVIVDFASSSVPSSGVSSIEEAYPPGGYFQITTSGSTVSFRSTAGTSTSSSTSTTSKGSYVGEVTSTNGSEYPTDGAHSDGYWYVYIGSRDETVYGYVRIGGSLKPLTGEGYVNKGGVLYPITTSSKVKIGSVLKSLLIGTAPSRLPRGYTEVEYIQSNKSQSQYLDTGFASTAGWKAELGWMFTETPTAEQDVIALAYQSGSEMWREYVIARNNQWALGHYTNSGYGGTANANVKYDIEVSTVSGNGYLNINGSQIFKYTTTYSAHAAHNLYVFAMNYKGAETFTSGRLYYLRLYNQSGTLVRDFVPCKNSSGTAGVYDLVEGKFYTNSGSGSFTAGAEVEV